MSGSARPDSAFVLSLVGGVLILADVVAAGIWQHGGSAFMWSGPVSGMMGSYGSMMSGMSSRMVLLFGGNAVLGVAAGVFVMLRALMLYMQPEQTLSGGTVIAVFSGLSLLGTGLFFIGAIVGLLGGLLALTSKRSAS